MCKMEGEQKAVVLGIFLVILFLISLIAAITWYNITSNYLEATKMKKLISEGYEQVSEPSHYQLAWKKIEKEE